MCNENKQETRGRKKLPDAKRRTKFVTARFTPVEHKAIERAAKPKGVSEWARLALLRASRQ